MNNTITDADISKSIHSQSLTKDDNALGELAERIESVGWGRLLSFYGLKYKAVSNIEYAIDCPKSGERVLRLWIQAPNYPKYFNLSTNVAGSFVNLFQQARLEQKRKLTEKQIVAEIDTFLEQQSKKPNFLSAKPDLMSEYGVYPSYPSFDNTESFNVNKAGQGIYSPIQPIQVDETL